MHQTPRFSDHSTGSPGLVTDEQPAFQAVAPERRLKRTKPWPTVFAAFSKVQEIQVAIDALKQAQADEKSCRQADAILRTGARVFGNAGRRYPNLIKDVRRRSA